MTVGTHYRHRSIRLQAYDYSQPGAYFVTMLAHRRRTLFGGVTEGRVSLSDWGQMVEACWRAIPDHFAHVGLDVWVIMPNHVHSILWLTPPDTPRGPTSLVRAQHAAPLQRRAPIPGSLGTIVRSFKSAVTKRINEARNEPGAPIWHRNYYERVIRDDDELNRIRQYILDNPAQWGLDRENPDCVGSGRPKAWIYERVDYR